MDRPARNDKLSYIIIGLLVVILGVQLFAMQSAEPVYMAVTKDGRVIPTDASSEPIVTDPVVLNWAMRAVRDSMTFKFSDIPERFQQNSKYFTASGFESFEHSLEKHRLLKMIRLNRSVLTPAVGVDTSVVKVFNEDGGYSWEVKVPLKTFQYEYRNYIDALRERDDWLLGHGAFAVTLIIKQSPQSTNEYGLIIEKWASRHGGF